MMEILFSGVEFKQNTLRMPSAGSWETKSQEYLRLNPAGTVPLLLHNGHPVYESNDQLKYVCTQCYSLGLRAGCFSLFDLINIIEKTISSIMEFFKYNS